ncbi:MAG TPA: endonuclease domain-containing protein [Pseudolabrys sp.]|nr:endonuclease domain-containing protein [Pseudolabrys sp.]
MSLQHAKQLRSKMTDAEWRLWYRLRAHRFAGYKFKRQVPIGPYVVDFACLRHQIVIEVDGGQHSESASDRQRDAWLQAKGLRVLRFWNDDIFKRTEDVLEAIHDALARRLRPLSRLAFARHPLPASRGEGIARHRFAQRSMAKKLAEPTLLLHQNRLPLLLINHSLTMPVPRSERPAMMRIRAPSP